MMKKLLSLLLAVIMVLSLVACSGNSDDDSGRDNDRDNNSSHGSKNDKGEDDNDDGDSIVIDNDDTSSEEIPVPGITFQETVFVNDENCTFTIKSIDPDGTLGYTLKVFLENKTDLNLMFSLDAVSVNGFMCDPFWGAQVSSGMKANEEITFYESFLEELDITNITDITFTLRIYDSDDFFADSLVEETFTIYPMGEDAVEPYVRTPVDNEIVLFETEDATMIIIGQKDDSMWGYTLLVYLENNTDRELMFSADEVAVNGFMCDPFWGTTVAPGKRAICPISWYDDSFAENNITEVESITLTISVYDYKNWMDDYIIDETFTIEPKF